MNPDLSKEIGSDVVSDRSREQSGKSVYFLHRKEDVKVELVKCPKFRQQKTCHLKIITPFQTDHWSFYKHQCMKSPSHLPSSHHLQLCVSTATENYWGAILRHTQKIKL